MNNIKTTEVSTYMRPRLILVLVLLIAMALPDAAAGLEGGWPSNSPTWRQAGAPPVQRPSAEARQAELDARAAAMQADIKRLTARVATAPDAATTTRFHAKLNEVRGRYGWVPELEMVWGVRDIQGILDNEATVPEDLLEALVQLKKDLSARGIDLIIMPFPPTPHYQGHLVIDGLGPDQDYTPGWSRMLIQMLEHDLEVIDTLDAYRKEAANPVVINWPNDFHTASLGRQITSRALAQRLQRYDFARDLAPHRRRWTQETRSHTGAGWPQRITMVNGMFETVATDSIPEGTRSWPQRHPRRSVVLRSGAPDLEQILNQRTFKYISLDLDLSGIERSDLARNDMVLIGDSQLHSSVHGAGLPTFIMAEVGGLFRWGSRSWRGFSPPDIYREVVPDDAEQPRVVVLACLVKYFWKGDGTYAPRPLPPLNPRKSADVPAAPFEATVRITEISRQLDPAKLDYDEALAHVAAVIEDGPAKGLVIGIRHWTMHGRERIAAAGNVRKGQTLRLRLQPWDQATAADQSIGQHMIFNDTSHETDLTIPIYWVTGGPLSPEVLLGERSGRDTATPHSMRHWTVREGRPLEARLISVDGTGVIVERADGQRLELVTDRLSEDDRAYLREIAR